MSNVTLTLIICGLLPVTLVIVVAIWGTLIRIRMANRILKCIKDGYYRDWFSSQNTKRLRWLLMLAMVSIIGIFIVTALVITDILALLSSPTLIAYILLASIGLFAGATLYKYVANRVK